jgi:hypothetical protein
VNTDDILAIGVDSKDRLINLNKYFKIQPDSMHLIDDYCGTKIKKMVLPIEASACEEAPQEST